MLQRQTEPRQRLSCTGPKSSSVVAFALVCSGGAGDCWRRVLNEAHDHHAPPTGARGFGHDHSHATSWLARSGYCTLAQVAADGLLGRENTKQGKRSTSASPRWRWAAAHALVAALAAPGGCARPRGAALRTATSTSVLTHGRSQHLARSFPAPRCSRTTTPRCWERRSEQVTPCRWPGLQARTLGPPPHRHRSSRGRWRCGGMPGGNLLVFRPGGEGTGCFTPFSDSANAPMQLRAVVCGRRWCGAFNRPALPHRSSRLNWRDPTNSTTSANYQREVHVTVYPDTLPRGHCRHRLITRGHAPESRAGEAQRRHGWHAQRNAPTLRCARCGTRSPRVVARQAAGAQRAAPVAGAASVDSGWRTPGSTEASRLSNQIHWHAAADGTQRQHGRGIITRWRGGSPAHVTAAARSRWRGSATAPVKARSTSRRRGWRLWMTMTAAAHSAPHARSGHDGGDGQNGGDGAADAVAAARMQAGARDACITASRVGGAGKPDMNGAADACVHAYRAWGRGRERRRRAHRSRVSSAR